jgi:hypothetical protein
MQVGKEMAPGQIIGHPRKLINIATTFVRYFFTEKCYLIMAADVLRNVKGGF